MSALLSAEMAKLFVFEQVFLDRPLPWMEFESASGARVHEPVVGLLTLPFAFAACEDFFESHRSLRSSFQFTVLSYQ